MSRPAPQYVNSIPDDAQTRTAEADRAWQRRDWKRLRELYEEQIEADARNVAVDLGLWWGLLELREYGLRGIYKLAKDLRLKRLGYPPSKIAPTYIRDEIRKGGESMRAQEEAESGKRPRPPDEYTREALETFSAEEWKDLIEEFGKVDVEILDSYLEANIGERERSLDQAQPGRLK